MSIMQTEGREEGGGGVGYMSGRVGHAGALRLTVQNQKQDGEAWFAAAWSRMSLWV